MQNRRRTGYWVDFEVALPPSPFEADFDSHNGAMFRRLSPVKTSPLLDVVGMEPDAVIEPEISKDRDEPNQV